MKILFAYFNLLHLKIKKIPQHFAMQNPTGGSFSINRDDKARFDSVFPCWERGVQFICDYWERKEVEYKVLLDKIHRSTDEKELMQNVLFFMARMTLVFDFAYSLLHGYMSKQYLVDIHRNFVTNLTSLGDDSTGDSNNPCSRSLCSNDGIWFLMKKHQMVHYFTFVNVFFPCLIFAPPHHYSTETRRGK